ncbi:MAG: amino acid permease [Bacteriovoracales bacterium]|nr:amino acid permease [Bacteriovoracales bacterium]
MQSLERRLGPFSLVTISISSMIGSGIFVLPSIGIATTGPSLFIAFALSALIILPAAMAKAELATAMPSSGGTYVYIERTFGPFFGTVGGLGLFLSILFKASFALVGLGAYFSVISSFPLYPTIFTFLGLIIVLNILGVGKVSGFLNFFLSITIIGLLVTMALSYPHWESARLSPILSDGYGGLAEATALVFVSFAGVTKVAAIAEEVIEPEKNLPRSILLSLFIVAILYCATALTLSLVFSPEEMVGETRPLYLLAKKVGHDYFGYFMALVAVITMVNTSNSGILAASRFPFAMSKDQLLPPFLGKLSPRFLTPVAGIVLSGVIISFALLTMDVIKMAKLASAFMIIIYMVENICVVVLRETRPRWYNPNYRAPFYPFLQLLGISSTLILLYFIGELALIAVLSIAIPGILFYITYSAKKMSRKGLLGIKAKRTTLIENEPAPRPRPRLGSYSTEVRAQAVVGLFGKEKSADILVEMGLALADHGHVEVVSLIEVPEQTTLGDIVEEPKEIRSLRRRIGELGTSEKEDIHFDSIVTHDLAKAIYEIGLCVHCRWLLVEWRGRETGGFTIHRPIGWLKAHLHCHLATYKDMGTHHLKSLLVLMSADRHDDLVIETAKQLGKTYGKEGIRVIKWASEKISDEEKKRERERLERVVRQFGSGLSVESKLIFGKDPVKSIVNETVEYDLLIMSSKDHSFFKSFRGAEDDRIIEKAACSVMAVHASSRLW